MPFVASLQPASLPPSAYVSRIDPSFDNRFRTAFSSDGIRSMLSDLFVGGVRYPLRRPLPAIYIPGVGEFLVDGFSPLFVGHGLTEQQARDDWQLALHAKFQELFYKRPFELTAEDETIWSVLTSRIDVAVYRNRTPLHVRQFGRVGKTRPFPQTIAWENGTEERIRLDQVDAPDFITYKSGQPFEAVVERDPVDFHLLRIVHIDRCSSPSRLPSREEAELVESIGSSKTLQAANWD